MSEFLLIHGSCHGAWCWRDLIPQLIELGHSVRAIDLPGNGDDQTPYDQVTLDGSRDAVLAACTPETIVVAHSWGGYPVSAAAEAEPSAMRGLIYLCAYVPVSGLSMAEMRQRSPQQSSVSATVRAADGLTISVDPDQAPALFYHDCPPQVVAYAVPRLCPQVIAPQTTPLTVTERLESLPRHYIVCDDDRTVPPEYQAEMTQDWPRERVHHLPTSHSAFFSAPAVLAALLGRIAQDM